jgi:hypothetical protein
VSEVDLLEDEWLIVRNSGEIPEITYHGSLYFLEKDPLGPGLELNTAQKQHLKEAAVERYQEIILRDVQIENYSKTIYRGVKRSIYNWHRYEAFCARQELECRKFRETVSTALLLFLDQAIQAAGKSLPEQFLNCRVGEIQKFMEDLGRKKEQLPGDLLRYCLVEPETTKGE